MEPLVVFTIEPTPATRHAIARLRRMVRGAATRGSLFNFTEEMDQVGKWLIRDARRRLAARRSKVSTGRLAKSLKHKPYKAAVTISSVLPYARIQQEGGTVRPRKRKYLAIPLRLHLARSHTWPKHWQPDRLACIRVGSKLYLQDTKTGAIVYRLVKQAKIPGRPYLVRSRALERLLEQLLAAKITKTLRWVFGSE